MLLHQLRVKIRENMKEMYMKLKILITTLTAAMLTSALAASSPETDKEKMLSLINDAKPYVAGMGKSASEVCHDMANDMVSKYGDRISELGKPPSEIRSSTSGICLNAVSAAEASSSLKEVDMWERSAIKNVDDAFHGNTGDPTPKQFLIDSITHSAKLARTISFAKEMSARYNH